jgi:hypothetical protein
MGECGFGPDVSLQDKCKCGCRQNKILTSARDRAMAELANERMARERDTATAAAQAASAQGELGILNAQAMPPWCLLCLCLTPAHLIAVQLISVQSGFFSSAHLISGQLISVTLVCFSSEQLISSQLISVPIGLFQFSASHFRSAHFSPIGLAQFRAAHFRPAHFSLIGLVQFSTAHFRSATSVQSVWHSVAFSRRGWFGSAHRRLISIKSLGSAPFPCK